MLHAKLTKLLNLTSSDNDPEALSAVRAANRLIKANGLTWSLLLLQDTPPPTRSMDNDQPSIQDMIDKIKSRVTDDFDLTFLSSVERQYKRRGKLTDGQIRALDNIYDIYVNNK